MASKVFKRPASMLSRKPASASSASKVVRAMNVAKRPASRSNASQRKPASSQSTLRVVSLGPRPQDVSEVGDAVATSDWSGEDVMLAPASGAERVGTVWLESAEASLFSSPGLDQSSLGALLQTLTAEANVTVVHESDDYLTEWNDASASCWGRIRRFKDAMIAPEPEQSIVYEDAVASAAHFDGVIKPVISCVSVQQSVQAAQADAWQRVVAVLKYDNHSFALVQEYDAEGAVVVLRGGELRPLFMLEVIMVFSDAMSRRTHGVYINARYCKFRHRYATWRVPTSGSLGPCASAFHSSLKEAFSSLGFSIAGDVLVQQLERVMAGFVASSTEKLVADAKLSAGCSISSE
eukprot:TRINITY_DN65362_c0_g1_i1.p1 TRINITY_DN65362_c0_g1~~TRINITY_DN65362_c0_g1_i1.p1  ORF type:complete len:350 (+),score=47.97 TRINITY_DN65362_c0_g1_i1:163-1212(+)